MRKILLSTFLVGAILGSIKSEAQCDLQFANLVISPVGDPVTLAPDKCEYRFNASFDIVTNSGFKYLFFHSWLLADYPIRPVFDCSGNTPAADPGTNIQLGTTVDQPGKSFLDIGFINLTDLTFDANTPVNVTANFATSYPNDNSVALTQPSNSTGLNAIVTRKGSSDTLHFDVTNIRIVINVDCNASLIVKSDIWGSNANAPDPKAQCYICGFSQSFDDPKVSLIKICASSPFKYDIGLESSSAVDIHVVYKLYAHDPLLGADPHPDDPLLFTSAIITLNSSTIYDPGPIDLPFPYCCSEPYSNWDLYVKVEGQEFSNVLETPIISQACATLPVNLRSFTAVRNSSLITLKWETVREENSKGFDIQRKLSNGAWQNIGYLDTKAVNGNSSSPLSYEFMDINKTKGITQYRLRQLDIDGKQSFSLIRSVRGDGQKGKTIIFPNPSSDGKVNVVFEDEDVSRNVSLIDMNGRVIRQWKNVLSNTLQIENLIPGFYTLGIINAETGEQIVEKIVVKTR
ncbi:MAG TPA: T9SS type A sorting domain-containing protein [Chitinophagaceae bacterium]